LNIFILSECPIEAAQMQCDKHVVKMCTESAQMLSTAHRMLDGISSKRPSKSGKRLSTHWIHPNPQLNELLYKAVHYNHPCTVWTMTSSANYMWHYKHFMALCLEYTLRYGKVHATESKLGEVLSYLPSNISYGSITPHCLAMQSNPECMFPDDPVKSYRAYYQTKQDRFSMKWTNRDVPDWFRRKEAG
jgi:hypothetical protein